MKRQSKKNHLSTREFRRRFFKPGFLALSIFTFSIAIGISGFHYIVGLEWIDAFLNASMILGGMGQISDLTTNADKIFAGCYALFSGVAFLSSMAIFFSPLLHRLLQKFHADIETDGDGV